VRDEKVLINQQETLSIQLTLHRIILAVRFWISTIYVLM
jgi:hypothetical protein